PEQIRNARTVDGRADVFALACILFECLTGRPAFDGDDPVSVLARILFEPLPVASAVRPDLPAALDALLLRMLGREADKRPTAIELPALLGNADATPGLAALGPPSAVTGRRALAPLAPVEATKVGPTLYTVSEVTAAPPSLQVGHNAV